MEHFLALAQSGVEGDGVVVCWVRLNENDIGAASPGNLLQCGDEATGDAVSAMALDDGQIIDIDLTPFALEFHEFIRLLGVTVSKLGAASVSQQLDLGLCLTVDDEPGAC